MVESYDIQNLLQTGYFTTSRGKSPKPPVSRNEGASYSRTAPPAAPAGPRPLEIRPVETYSRGRQRNYPPPPSVEDEATSLSREYDCPVVPNAEDVPPSRGEVDQNPVIMEVHEYNPERRFVLLGCSPTDSGEESSDNKRPEGRPPRYRRSSDDGSATETGRRTERNLKVDSTYSKDEGKPRIERRRSRQDLPRLDTELKADRVPEHHRARSTGQAPQPDLLSARQPRPYADTKVAPDVIKHGSSGREKAYRDYGQPQTADRKTATQKLQADDRRYNDTPTRGSSTPTTSKRSEGKAEAERSSRPYSNDRIGGPRYYGEQPARSSRRERSPPPRRSDRDEASSSKYQTREPTTRREESRSGDEYVKGARDAPRPRRKSVVVQDGRDSLPKLEKEDISADPRLKARGPTMPLPTPTLTGFPVDINVNPRNASTFPISRDAQRPTERPVERPAAPPKAQLPYPDDDDFSIDPLSNPYGSQASTARYGTSQYESQPPVAMPSMPIAIAIGPETPLEARPQAPPQSAQIPAGSQSWQPPSFDPERDRVHLDRPVGTYRRYSEKADTSAVPNFPECRRKHPIAGMVDWLTLPRTDFNICPDCYGAVFADSQYRTLFQPMLRPSNRPISCDFGLYPWYRIAWLLTLKNELPDLRLFHQVANVMSATRDKPCPGNRETTRDWLTIANPYTRQGVYDFATCYQCAGVIEALLPNLTGLFVPLDPRADPIRRSCSMRFTPKRRRFVMYFDAIETTSDRAQLEKTTPDLQNLADELEKMTSVSECREDGVVVNGYWHIMQYLPSFTVCGECFEDVVRPRLKDDSVIARNFYAKPQRIKEATCQLYSPRMRDVFNKACRLNDPEYLEKKAKQRKEIELDIQDRLRRLYQSKEREDWVEEQVSRLVREWEQWE